MFQLFQGTFFTMSEDLSALGDQIGGGEGFGKPFIRCHDETEKTADDSGVEPCGKNGQIMNNHRIL